MRQGMEHGRPSPDRRGTSRVSKPSETKRVQAPGKPATTRMGMQGAAAARGDSQQRQGGQAPAQDSSKTTLYLGIGGGALVFVLILAFVLGGGDSGGGQSGGPGADTLVNRAIQQATNAHQRGEYRVGLDICDEALKEPKARRSSRYTALQQLRNSLYAIVTLDQNAQVKVGEFKKKIEAAKADQTAMAKANQFWDECNVLLGEFGATPSAKELRGIKEDLGRWVSTERQGNWQKDYNVTKARIEKSFLNDQRFGEAIREWKQFGEISQDPLLHSRIEQEVRTVNQLAQAAAEKVVTDAGAGADARAKLEEAQQRFNGTDGLIVINKAIKSLK
jgi:hypothetical protein